MNIKTKLKKLMEESPTMQDYDADRRVEIMRQLLALPEDKQEEVVKDFLREKKEMEKIDEKTKTKKRMLVEKTVNTVKNPEILKQYIKNHKPKQK